MYTSLYKWSSHHNRECKFVGLKATESFFQQVLYTCILYVYVVYMYMSVAQSHTLYCTCIIPQAVTCTNNCMFAYDTCTCTLAFVFVPANVHN